MTKEAVRDLDMHCVDCGVDTDEIDEFYMVHDHIWDVAVPVQSDRDNRVLCVGCLETRIGRELSADDFTDAPVNRSGYYSNRLFHRLTSRK
jgi:hypothetical protein